LNTNLNHLLSYNYFVILYSIRSLEDLKELKASEA